MSAKENTPWKMLDPDIVDRSWPEDATHENGNYMCHCVVCKHAFVGHKRRVVCKPCATEARQRWDALTPEQRAVEEAEHLEAIQAWLREHSVEFRGFRQEPAES